MAKRKSIVGIPRLKTLCEIAAMEVPNLKGELAEVGVYKGGSARALADLFPDRRMLLFDTFEGIPDEKLEKQDNPKLSGRFADTSLEEVKQYLKDNKNCEFYPGLFPESLSQLSSKDIQFALVHVDCDLYRTILDCCEFFYPRMAKGGLIFFDDYSWLGGARKAVHQFFSDKPEKLIRPDFRSTGGTCYVRKI